MGSPSANGRRIYIGQLASKFRPSHYPLHWWKTDCQWESRVGGTKGKKRRAPVVVLFFLFSGDCSLVDV